MELILILSIYLLVASGLVGGIFYISQCYWQVQRCKAGKESMIEIVSSRISTLSSGCRLLNDALDLFYNLRNDSRVTNLSKEPSTAELLNWLQMLMHRGIQPGQNLTANKGIVLETLSLLVKNQNDRQEASDFIQNRWGNS